MLRTGGSSADGIVNAANDVFGNNTFLLSGNSFRMADGNPMNCSPYYETEPSTDSKVLNWWQKLVWHIMQLSNEAKIVIGILLIVALAVLTVVTSGATSCLFATMLEGAITGAFIGAAAGAVIGGIAAAVKGGSGEDVVNAMFDGFADGFLSGAISGAISSAISWANNPACFIAGTLVLAKEGKKAKENIVPGDEVLAYDEATGEMQYKKVARVFRNTTDKWCTVTVEVNGKTEKITSTPGHKYYLPFNSENREKDLIPEHANYITLSDKWVSACKLNPGDKVLLFNKTYAIIKAVEVVCLSTPEVTYNFEVEDFHTYFVGNNPVCVHNANCGGKYNPFRPEGKDGLRATINPHETEAPHAHIFKKHNNI